MSDRWLEPAFRATTYRVESDIGAFALRIGEPNQAFDTWLRRNGVTYWVVLTACNPGGVRTDEENLQRHDRLLQRVDALGCRCFPACNLADDRQWPAEPGVLLLQVAEEAAQVLASEFSQSAFVAGKTGSLPYLVWSGNVT